MKLEDQSSDDVCEETSHREEVPDAPHTCIRSEYRPVCDAFDNKLEEECEAECRLGDIISRPVTLHRAAAVSCEKEEKLEDGMDNGVKTVRMSYHRWDGHR